MTSILININLDDDFTSALDGIIVSANLVVFAMEHMQDVMSAGIATDSFAGARDEMVQTAEEIQKLETEMSNLSSLPRIPQMDSGPSQPINTNLPAVIVPQVENPSIMLPVIQPNAPPAPVKVPIKWQTERLEVFSGSGIQRFQQEIESANAMMEQLVNTQGIIGGQARVMNIFPPEAFNSLDMLANRIDVIRNRIQQIGSNPLNLGSDTANAELEQLRSKLDMAIQQQRELDAAVSDLDVSGANEAYLNLSRTVGGIECYIRDNVNEQGQFNQVVEESKQKINGLMTAVKNTAAQFINKENLEKVLNLSDELVQFTIRLDMMNDGEQTTQELVNMVYAAAQDSRSSFGDMTNMVSMFEQNAGDSFGSSKETVAFAALLRKQMAASGVSAQDAANAESELAQALGSGVLQGDKLNSIFGQAPELIQHMADYMNMSIDQFQEMAAEGGISADVIKAAIFASADEINAKFEAMPMTWGQVWQSMKNTALIAFMPLLQRLNDIANSEAFQSFANGITTAMAVVSKVLLDIFNLFASIGGFIADNWSIIAPVIYGIAAALLVYNSTMGIGWLTTMKDIAAKGAHAIASAAETASILAMTLAQDGLNAALAACPIAWVIILIIALIAVIFAVCNAIAKMTGVANSGFGVMTGGVNVVIQFFKNLGLVLANVALGIWNAMGACATNLVIAFGNAIAGIQSCFYNLLSTALITIAKICETLNKLPFVEFDYSGIASAADDYTSKAQNAANSKSDYVNVGDAFREGFGKYDTFAEGWASDAFASGAEWGDGIADKIGSFHISDLLGVGKLPSVDDYASGFGEAMDASGLSGNMDDIAGDTGSIKDSLDCTQEDLKYLRDIAEQEAVNRFTIAEVKVEQTNHNNINSGMDLDGVVSGLTDAVGEAVDNITEGVHA